MGFTVKHAGDTRDVEFGPYAQLLHRQGVDLACMPRVPEPGTGRRWLHYWESRADAQAFAEELKKRTSDDAWEVVEVDGQPSEGPIGPLEIRFGQRNTGYGFDLHPFSQMLLEKHFPNSTRMHSVSIHTENTPDVPTARRQVPSLADAVASILTGATHARLIETFGGYRIYDMHAKREMASSGPDPTAEDEA
jgi:hypothetical protein